MIRHRGSAVFVAVFLALPAPALAEWRDLLPRGWTVDASAEGDLNGDGRPDVAVILSRRAADGAVNEARLLVYMQRRDGGYDLHTDAPKAACLGCADAQGADRAEGEPLIKNGILELRYRGPRNVVTTRWRLAPVGRFNLIGFTRQRLGRGALPAGEVLSAAANVSRLLLVEIVAGRSGFEKRECRVPARFREIALPGFDFANVEPWPSCVAASR